MDFLEILGAILAIILLFKSTVFITYLLLAQYGRKIGLGVKYISDNGEFAVISGATGCLGREFTQEFASMGYNLVLIARNGQKLDRLEQQIRKKYNTMKHVIKIAVDVTKSESYEKIKQQLAEVNPIVVLVNCMSTCP
ncbi:inactive hydroxysteroid dehydrogenase-like protein, partial [Euroglyphus maynei]